MWCAYKCLCVWVVVAITLCAHDAGVRRLQAQLQAAAERAEQQAAASSKAIAEECERHLTAERALQQQAQQLSSELATSKVRAVRLSRASRMAVTNNAICGAVYTTRWRSGFCSPLLPLPRLQAAIKSAEQRIAELQAALQRGEDAAAVMADKVAQALTSANARVEDLQVGFSAVAVHERVLAPCWPNRQQV